MIYRFAGRATTCNSWPGQLTIVTSSIFEILRTSVFTVTMVVPSLPPGVVGAVGGSTFQLDAGWLAGWRSASGRSTVRLLLVTEVLFS